MINFLTRSGFYIIAFLLIFSCEKEEAECDPLFDPNCGSSEDQSSPETSILEASVDNSSVSISWEGNEAALSFSYHLEPLDYDNPISIYLEWSEWSSDTSVTIGPLDEGGYNFYIKSRYNIETEEEASEEINFTIDAIQDAGLRIYPMWQQVDPGSTVDIFVYAENITDILGAQIELHFSSDILEYSSSVPECGVGNGFLCPDASSGDNIIIWEWNPAGSFDSSQPIYQLRFQPKNEGTADIILFSAIVRDSEGAEVEIETLQNAQIEVLP